MEYTIDNKTQVSKPLLEGFKIHNAEFKGVEKTDFKNGEYKVIVIKFENEYGTFRDTIFEPKAADGKRTQSQYGENPSNVELISEKFKMLVEAVNPELAKQIADGTKKFSVKTWDNMRDLFVKATEKSVGVKTQIKLDKNNKGEGCFPGFFLGLSKEGNLYRKSTFIGNNLGFTAKELERQSKYTGAKVTKMKPDNLNIDLSADPEDSKDELNLTNIDDLDL